VEQNDFLLLLHLRSLPLHVSNFLITCRAIPKVPLLRLGDVSPSSPTLQPQSIEAIFEEIFGDSSESIFTTSQVDDDDDQHGYSESASTSTNLGTTKSSKIFAVYASKSSKSKSNKSSKSSPSKSMKGLSYLSLEGKADKWGDDPSLLILEQLRYKIGNGGRSSGSGRRELILLMITSIAISSYLVWQ